MADSDNTLKLLIEMGVIGQGDVQAANDLLKDTGKVAGGTADASGDLAAATKKTGAATDEATGKFSASHREIRMLGNELGRVAGVSGMGMLFLGGVAAAAFGAAKAIGLVKTVWEEIQATIKGPIQIDIPPEAAGHITALAEAWNAFAEARAKVIAAANTPQADASREEKKLTNELKLIHEVLAAEREKAMIEAGDDKAAQERVREQFDHAGKMADEDSRQKQIKVKEDEVAKLVADAQRKLKAAGEIPVTNEEDAQKRQKVLDENAAAAAADLKQREERIAMIDRVSQYKAGGTVAEYEGSTGQIKRLAEEAKLYAGWGNMGDLAGYRASETTHAGLDQASIDRAETYRKTEEEKRKRKTKLGEEAGTESGQAEVLSGQIADDKAAATAQATADAQVAALHKAGGTEGRIKSDVDTINKFDQEKNHNAESLSKAATAITDLNATLAANRQFLGYFATLGLSAKQLKADQDHLAREMAGLAAQVANSRNSSGG
jgi:hypothetical protein